MVKLRAASGTKRLFQGPISSTIHQPSGTPLDPLRLPPVSAGGGDNCQKRKQAEAEEDKLKPGWKRQSAYGK